MMQTIQYLEYFMNQSGSYPLIVQVIQVLGNTVPAIKSRNKKYLFTIGITEINI